ncbi:hypothetical protein DR31_26515 [Salmonella enterica subsp. enterica]|nr:hypothetical protein [Salmonella enterica subsp. enterica serovar Weltevreden]ECH9064864.1 hypothetical protein [Salmonella enterica subsp. enterica]EGI5530594.1 hypothetical protein [Salmonella enterica subsp. enterica serovar Weltevreden]
MFCDHSQFAHVTKQRDKMCFWSTAGTPMTPGQALPDTRMFAICLLPFCYLFATCLLSVCYLFATATLCCEKSQAR